MLETPEIVLEQELKEGSMTPPLEEEEEATIEPSKAEATIEPLVTISAPPIEPMKRDSIIIQNRVLDAIFKNRSRISSVNSSRNSVVSNSSENIEVPNKLAISNFDFLLAEVPSSQDKINYKLMNIRYRLDVELKVKIGTERMRDAIKAGGSDLKRLGIYLLIQLKSKPRLTSVWQRYYFFKNQKRNTLLLLY